MSMRSFIQLFSAGLVLLGSGLVQAVPPPPPEVSAVQRVFHCLEGPSCAADSVFIGDALKRWPEMEGKRAQYTLKKATFVRQIPAEYAEKWQKRWTKEVDALGPQYDKAAARTLGLGKSSVRVHPRVALALVELTVQVTKENKEDSELVIMISWEDPAKAGEASGMWKVAFLEDSLSKIGKFLKAHPPG